MQTVRVGPDINGALHYERKDDGMSVNSDHFNMWGQGFYALVDTEKLCGEADMTGLDTKGGVSIYAFFRGLMQSFGGAGLDGAASENKGDSGIRAVYIHTHFVKMMSLSAAGVEIEE